MPDETSICILKVIISHHCGVWAPPLVSSLSFSFKDAWRKMTNCEWWLIWHFPYVFCSEDRGLTCFFVAGSTALPKVTYKFHNGLIGLSDAIQRSTPKIQVLKLKLQIPLLKTCGVGGLWKMLGIRWGPEHPQLTRRWGEISAPQLFCVYVWYLAPWRDVARKSSPNAKQLWHHILGLFSL